MMAKRTEELTPREEEVLFFMDIGMSLTMWSSVEIALWAVVRGGLPHDSVTSKAVAVGFFSLEGARAKRVFAEATVNRMIAGHPLRPQWIKLVDRVRQAADKRNVLAHWQVQVYEHARPGRRYALEHPIQPKKKPKTKVPLPRPGAYCLRDIVKIRLEFFSLQHALDNFLSRLSGVKEQYPASAEQPENPPQIGQLRRHLLAILRRNVLEPSEVSETTPTA
jgi:hypothetical protein